MDGDDATEVARLLRAILEALERGELDAPVSLIARLEGALALADAVSTPPA